MSFQNMYNIILWLTEFSFHLSECHALPQDPLSILEIQSVERATLSLVNDSPGCALGRSASCLYTFTCVCWTESKIVCHPL